MSDKVELSGGIALLLGVAATAGIVFALQAASGILVPILLAVFLALICTGPMLWLVRRGVPEGVALLIVLVAIFGLLFGVGALVGSSVPAFTNQLPVYQQRLESDFGALIGKLEAWGVPVAEDELLQSVDPSAALGFAGTLMSGLSSAMGNSFLIGITMIFMLLEASQFGDKLRVALGDDENKMEALSRFQHSLNRYMGLKAAISAVTGIVVTIFLLILKVDFALIFGLLAFLLNFIPNIGSILAAVPAVLIAYLQHGPGTALVVIAGYVGVNLVMGNVVEPRVMGEGMGLSALVVFLSLIIWGWIFGTVGMLLSVPLTMSVKIALETNEQTRRFAILLGPKLVED